jgi:sugar phosphate isomerase/epimerase
VDLYSETNASSLLDACEKYSVRISTIWAGVPGRLVWNFIEGPSTIGLVPPETRAERVQALKQGADFAKSLNVESITTHAGFIPEAPNDPLYAGTIEALHEVISYCKSLGLYFCFETGQETPTTLLRAFEDLALDNIGVNLDPANLLMYGKANPIDALDILGPFVRGVHAKDGEYPTNGRALGEEKPLGEGRVNFPALIPKLKAFGYAGSLTIEREISGEKQLRDIRRAIEVLTPLC